MISERAEPRAVTHTVSYKLELSALLWIQLRLSHNSVDCYLMKLGLGLYRSLLTEDNFKFAKQAGVTHLVVHLVDYFKGADPVLTSGTPNLGWGITQNQHKPWTEDDLRGSSGRSKATDSRGKRSRTSIRRTGATSCSTARRRRSRWKASSARSR